MKESLKILVVDDDLDIIEILELYSDKYDDKISPTQFEKQD